MDTLVFLLDIVKYTLSGLLVVLCSYFLFKSQFDAYYNLKELDYKSATLKNILPLKLQAYERMALFLERINPANLLVRLHNGQMNARQLQSLILTEIRAEYQHNVSQQIYISADCWAIIKRVKEDTIAITNSSMAHLDSDASALELSRVILSRLDSLEENPYELALMLLKSDIQEM